MSKKPISAARAVLSPILSAAFPYTVPVLAGYGCLGIALGILMSASGFSPVITVAMSLIIYAGSGQFAAVNLLLAAFNPIGVFLLEVMINARHIFYGLSMLEKYNDAGRKKWYMIAALTDETFSINCGIEHPPDVDRHLFMLAVTVLNHSYWVIATAIGAVCGVFVKFNTEGMDFVMTALFIVIFLEQWLKEKNHTSTVIGLVTSFICLLIFGAGGFLIPSMLVIFMALIMLKRPIDRAT